MPAPRFIPEGTTVADWVPACVCDDIDEEDVIRWDYEGRTYAIYRAEDGFYCTDGLCTHEDEHLETGFCRAMSSSVPFTRACSTSDPARCSHLRPASISTPIR